MTRTKITQHALSIALGAMLISLLVGCSTSGTRTQIAAEDTAPSNTAAAQDPSTLVGKWTIDLRPTAESEPYLTKLVIKSVDGSTFSGTFYNGTRITDAQISTTFGALRFAFVTNDGSGDYHTTGEVRGNQITGTTHSLGRGFLMPWRGERTD